VDPKRSFSVREIVCIGLVSGITVGLVKLIQLNFTLDDVTWTHSGAAVITTLAYMALGAIGAYFLVDHDARGQKMLKNAFLMGFVAPSFFLALANNPGTVRPNFQKIIDRVP
jgi:ABC-type spermidine/putrescine transport system permease subunit II